MPEELCAGDLNNDGQLDILMTTQPKYYLNILRATDGGRIQGNLESVFRFQIFEEKSFMRGGLSYGPREMEVADLTGDGKDDLVMLIHDRLLLYVQDP